MSLVLELRWLIWLLIFQSISSAGPISDLALAEPPPTKPITQPLKIGGEEGIWYPQDKARKLLKDIETLNTVKKTLAATEQLLNLERRKSTLLKENEKTAKALTHIWKTTAEEQARLNTGKNPWWKSPLLWSGIGFVLGTASAILICATIDRVTVRAEGSAY